MEAGRELDELVAKRVLGWKSTLNGWGCPNDKSYRYVPESSTSWYAMREVVEAMRARGYFFSCFLPVTAGWSAEARFYSDVEAAQYIGRALELPLAVCLAAIEAMKAES